MELSPEERKRIYEEEKARIEAERRLEQEKRAPVYDTSTGLAPNVEALLCYLGGWITGLIFFILEQKNARVRFHAAQSIVVFGALNIAVLVVGWIPIIGAVLAGIIVIIAFIFWIVLMVKAYQGERYMVPAAGEVAERMVTPAGQAPETYRYTPPPPAFVATETPPATEAPPVAEAPPPHIAARDERVQKRTDTFRRERREARIAGSAVAIAWFIVLLLFFNFFHQYAAYYSAETVDGATIWTRQSFFTDDISRWLPILNVTLGVAIIGHFLLMFLENDILRRTVRIVMDGLGLATVVTLLAVRPFDFSIIPDNNAETITQLSVTAVLILIAVGFGISLIVRVIKLLIHAARQLSGGQEEA